MPSVCTLENYPVAMCAHLPRKNASASGLCQKTGALKPGAWLSILCSDKGEGVGSGVRCPGLSLGSNSP